MVNLTDARASIVKQLNSKNISVSAWLLVDKDDGKYLTSTKSNLLQDIGRIWTT